MLLFLSEAEAEGGEPESEADAESSEAELVEPESKSLEEEIEESGENSKELKRKARKIVNKSVDISIGYVTSSVSTGKRRRRRQTSDEKDFIGKIPKIFYCYLKGNSALVTQDSNTAFQNFLIPISINKNTSLCMH